MRKIAESLAALLVLGFAVGSTKAAMIYDGRSGNLGGTYYADSSVGVNCGVIP